MLRYFAILSKGDDGKFRVLKKLRVTAEDDTDCWQKAYSWQEKNNIKGTLFTLANENAKLLTGDT